MLHFVPPDHSALATLTKPPLPVPHGSVGNQVDKSMRHCDYCDKDNHTRETCIKLHGRPRGRGGRTGSGGGRFGSRVRSLSQAHFFEGSASTLPYEIALVFSQYQILALQHMLSQQSEPSSTSSSTNASHSSTSNLAHSGIISSVYNVSSLPSSSKWCLDSSANEHMTSSSEVFDSYTPCFGRGKIRVADDSLSLISGKGRVLCAPSISLSFVLHVLGLCANLLSIYHLCLELNCFVAFFSTHCVF
ncbi:hypothetical protein CFOL_v3_09372 [Cephalotus follicularis]|uniref:Retrovirus-related Pol polyprotein from transposon TNT 1-94-like beta-barrel domain-containing protein n=1 Tax=Cephalotus follicularis TaxID=3775 RepID=A0A1Q3BD21_CEPFO|nr:hypothetical protein CFOL_v3_09372 [Cephalotus follicularis]